MNHSPTALLLKVFLPFAAGYFLSYLYRVVNAVISTDLVADIGIGPSALGLLTATYFISFASFQLPLGVLLDRFGPRRTESILLLFAAAGAYIFSQAQSLSGLIVGRAFIGQASFNKAVPEINKLSPQQVYEKLKNFLPRKETRDYIEKVARRMEKYR